MTTRSAISVENNRQALTRETTKRSSNYFPFLEGLRGLAALYVMVHHDWMDTWNLFLNEPQPGGIVAPLVGWLAYGHAAVTMFIAISGFCLMLPVMNYGGQLKDWRVFLKRRAVRILPPYYAALIIGTASAFLMGWRITGMSILSHVLVVHNFTPYTFDLNGPLWSVATECQIYLVFPLLVWFYRYAGMVSTILLTAVIGYGFGHPLQTWGGIERNPHYLYVFTIGMFAAWLISQETRQSFRKPSVFFTLLGVSATGMVACYDRWGPAKHIEVTDFFTSWLAFSILVLGSTQPTLWLTRALCWRPLLGLGAFSYSLYLVHQPLQVLMTRYLLEPFGLIHSKAFLIRLALLPIIIGSAYLFFLFVERPFLRQTKRGSRVAEQAT